LANKRRESMRIPKAFNAINVLNWFIKMTTAWTEEGII
jgi:hypothetical protein